MEKTLQLIFKNSKGDKKVLSITFPKENVTEVEARACANAIVTANVFTSGGYDLTEYVEARLRTVSDTALA